jgi:hypothetical protein
MIDYIPFETALRMLAAAYVASAILLLAATYIGWAVIETIEESRRL